MNAQLYRIINTGDQIAPVRRRRQWLDIGQAFVVAGYILLPVCGATETEPHFEIFDQQGKTHGVSPMMPMTFQRVAPYQVIPRAMRLTPTGTVIAVLIETQYTGTDKPGWATNESDKDDCNANFQPIPDSC